MPNSILLTRTSDEVIDCGRGDRWSRYRRVNLGASSFVSRLLNSMLEKDLLLDAKTMDGSSYRGYKVFFSSWLERLQIFNWLILSC